MLTDKIKDSKTFQDSVTILTVRLRLIVIVSARKGMKNTQQWQGLVRQSEVRLAAETCRTFKIVKQKMKKDLWWFHVQHFGDASLHDEEMWVVDIQLHWTEQILHTIVVGVASVDQVLVAAPNNHLFNKQILLCQKRDIIYINKCI